MELILYKNFAKKINSTKIPDNTVTSVTMEAYVKQPTSLENPTFIVDGIDLEMNYCKWADHYYFIDDITVGNNNIYELHCTIDVLATWKTEIGATTQYVERAYTLNSETEAGSIIPDNMYPTLPTITSNIIDVTGAPDWLDGIYVLSFLQHDSKTVFPEGIYRGGIVYALLLPSQAEEVLKNIQVSAASSPDVNVLSFFTSLIYIPINIGLTYTGTSYEYIISGAPNVYIPKNTTTAGIASSGLYTTWGNRLNIRMTGALPRHPQYALGDYLNYKPFNQYMLHAGPFGDIDIPVELLSFNSSTATFDFWLSITYDLCTGDGILGVYPNSTQSLANAIARRGAHIGVNIAMSEISAIGSSYAKQKYDLARAQTITSGMVSATAALATHNPFSAAGAAGNTILSLQALSYDYANATLPGAYTAGSNGNFSDLTIPFNVIQASRNVLTTRANDKYGRLVNKNIRIDTLSGFIKCHSFVAEIPCHLSEYQQIETYTINGFYYE